MNRIFKTLFLCGFAACCGLGSFACSSTTTPSFGSETHFLSRCVSDETCGEGLACVCGSCTLECTRSEDCGGAAETSTCHARTTRPLAQACGDVEVEATCEVTCTADDDCRGLDGSYECDRGLCRQVSEACMAAGRDVDDLIVLGDRFLANSGEVTVELAHLMTNVGVLTAGEVLRDYSSGVVSPFGGADDVFSQYENAKTDGPSEVVIMNAGGPDALLECDIEAAELCPTLQTAKDGTESLLSAFAQDGVQQVILFFYPRPNDEVLADKFDILQRELEQVCKASLVSCHFLPLSPIFEEQRDTLLTGMGLFPSADGAVVAAGALFGVMRQQCIIP